MPQLIDRRHETTRGRILQILVVRYPDPISFGSLLSEVVGQGEILGSGDPGESRRALAFHVEYLRNKGYVDTQKLLAGRAQIELQTVRLTARGVDLVDGRLDSDPGVFF